MTPFESLYSLLLPFEHPLHQHVHRTLRAKVKDINGRGRLLDVGGRRSNYTINLQSEVWITDVPREREIQHTLDLGATDEIRAAVLGRRSNVHAYLYDDMTTTGLPESHFDVVVAVEVLEHVAEDEAFVSNVHRVLRPGGTFVMSTPNGDFRPIPYPDHKRHYRAQMLQDLLSRYFPKVQVEYRVNSDSLFRAGLHKPNGRAPLRTALGMCAFAASAVLERLGFGGTGPSGKLHLFAVCRKAD